MWIIFRLSGKAGKECTWGTRLENLFYSGLRPTKWTERWYIIQWLPTLCMVNLHGESLLHPLPVPRHTNSRPDKRSYMSLRNLQQISVHLHYKKKDIFLTPGKFNGRWKERMKVGGREVRERKMSLCWWNSYWNLEKILNMLFWKVLKIIKEKRAVKKEQGAMNWEIKYAQCGR